MTNSAVVVKDGHWGTAQEVVSNPNDLVAHASLVVLVKQVADTLELHYPLWNWVISPDEIGGVVNISCLRISTRVVYTLHTSKLQNDWSMRSVIRAGGEYLERFGFRRGGYTHAEWKRRELVLGQFIPDVSDLPKHEKRSIGTQNLKQALKTGHARITTDTRIGAALAERKLLHGA